MVEFVARSGAQVKINSAPWIDAKNLKKAIQKEVDFSDMDIGEKWFMQQIFKVDGSDVFEAALWNCLKHCTYTPAGAGPETVLRISQDMLNSKESRADYLEIVENCVRENLGPLVESLFSRLFKAGILKKQAENQESESTTTASSSPAV